MAFNNLYPFRLNIETRETCKITRSPDSSDRTEIKILETTVENNLNLLNSDRWRCRLAVDIAQLSTFETFFGPSL